MLDNSAMLDNRVVLLDTRVPVLDNIAALDNMRLSYSCHVKADSPPVFGKFLALARMTAIGCGAGIHR